MISIDFALRFVIFQRVFQLTSSTFVNALFWRKEISDILSVMDVMSWLQSDKPAHQRGTMQILLSIIICPKKKKSKQSSWFWNHLFYTPWFHTRKHAAVL